MKIVDYTWGAVAGIFDLCHNLNGRNWIVDRSTRSGAFWTGFDLTSDLYRFDPRRKF